MDISQIIDRAKEMSQENEGDTEKNGLQGNDIDGIMQAVRLIKLFSELNNNNSSNNTIGANTEASQQRVSEDILSVCEESGSYYEQDMQTPAIKTIKAAIPYLDYEYQRNIGIMVKLIELDNLIKHYASTASAMSVGRKEGWQKDMLLSMKNVLDKKTQYYIDMIIRFIDISEIMAMINKEEKVNDSDK